MFLSKEEIHPAAGEPAFPYVTPVYLYWKTPLQMWCLDQPRQTDATIPSSSNEILF